MMNSIHNIIEIYTLISIIYFSITYLQMRYHEQPYGFSQFISGMGQLYFFIAGFILSFAGLIIAIATYIANAPIKVYGLAFVFTAFGFFMARNAYNILYHLIRNR